MSLFFFFNLLAWAYHIFWVIFSFQIHSYFLESCVILLCHFLLVWTCKNHKKMNNLDFKISPYTSIWVPFLYSFEFIFTIRSLASSLKKFPLCLFEFHTLFFILVGNVSCSFELSHQNINSVLFCSGSFFALKKKWKRSAKIL